MREAVGTPGSPLPASFPFSWMFPFSGMPYPAPSPPLPPLCFWGAHHPRVRLEQVLLLRCERCRGAPSTSCPPRQRMYRCGGEEGWKEGDGGCTCHPPTHSRNAPSSRETHSNASAGVKSGREHGPGNTDPDYCCDSLCLSPQPELLLLPPSPPWAGDVHSPPLPPMPHSKAPVALTPPASPSTFIIKSFYLE